MKIGKPGQFFVVCDFETTGISPRAQPIEVGMVLCDHELNVLGTYSRLIQVGVEEWTDADELAAAKVHKISPVMLMEDGLQPTHVAQDIGDFLRLHVPAGARKPVLISDNIQFEWRHLQTLLAAREVRVEDWFHYCGWDTSLLFEATGVVEGEHPHRALPDAMWVWHQLVDALRKTGTLKVRA